MEKNSEEKINLEYNHFQVGAICMQDWKKKIAAISGTPRDSLSECN